MESTIKKPIYIATATITGNSGSQGAVNLSSVISANDLVLAVVCTSNANAMCFAWKYNNSTWFAKVVDWRNLAVINQDMTLVVKYIPNGMI